MNLVDMLMDEEMAVDNPADVLLNYEMEKPELVCIDTETPSLDWFKYRAFAATVCWKEHESYYLDVQNDPEAVRVVWKIMTSAPQLVFHNAKFDLHVLRELFADHKLPLVVRKIEDTMLLDYCLDEQRHHGLKELSEMFGIPGINGTDAKDYRARIDGWLDEQEKLHGSRPNWDLVPKHMMIPYAIQDAHLTLSLWKILQQQMADQIAESRPDRRDVNDIYALETRLVWVILNAEKRGIRVDLDFVERNVMELNPAMEQHRLVCKDLTGWDINPGSTEDVARALQQFGEFSDRFINQKTGKAKLPEWVLTDLLGTQIDDQLRSVVTRVLDYRTDQKVIGYFEQLQTGYIPDDQGQAIIRCNTKQHGARTGRTSVTNPPLQTIPREKGNVRGAFIAREGHTLIFADYSGQELRILAHYLKAVGDDSMAKIFEANGDLHWATAEAVFEQSRDLLDSKVHRQGAKSFNFAIVYGAGVPKLMAMLGSPPCGVCDNCRGIGRRRPSPYACSSPSGVRGRALLANYHAAFPGLNTMKQTAERLMRDRGYVVTAFGRRHREKNGRFAYKAINSIVQGTGADVVKSAMVKVEERTRAAQLDAKILLMIHDELIVEVPDEQLDEATQFLRATMIDVPEISVPMDVDINVAKRWSLAKG